MMLHAFRRGSRVPLLALSFAGLLACKSEISVDAYVEDSAKDVCDAVIACACEYPNGAIYEHCVGELTVNLDSAAQVNIVEGLSFDGHCADEVSSAIKELGCGVTASDPDAECEAPCKIWHGPVGKGSTCTSVNGYDNCKQGLVCGGDGVCVDPCAKPDVPGVGEVCGPLLGCVDGAFCDTDIGVGLNAVCQLLPLAGEPCTAGESLCAEDLLCDVTMPGKKTCAALPGLGAECIDFQCAEDLYCDSENQPGVCAAVPTLGAACPFGACLAPYVCNSKAVCEEPPPQICGAYGGLPLEECKADEFTCGDGACIASAKVCDETMQCSDGSDEAPLNPECQLGCTVDEFQCVDGSCIDQAGECDDFEDCADGSDELPNNPNCII